jgi:hypothetical protein
MVTDIFLIKNGKFVSDLFFKELDKYKLYFIYAYGLMFWLYLSFYVFLSEN